jgi:hypothetical protein
MKTKHFMIAAMGKTIVIFTALMLLLACDKTDETDAPPGSDPNGTWTFGSQTWSAPVQNAAGCVDYTQSADGSNATPIYADLKKGTGYYYNWLCVKKNANALCPTPWRIPTTADYEMLMASVNCIELRDAWRLDGVAGRDERELYYSTAFYWTSDETDWRGKKTGNIYSIILFIPGYCKWTVHPELELAKLRCLK